MPIQIRECLTSSDFRVLESAPEKILPDDAFLVPALPGTITKIFKPASLYRKHGKVSGWLAYRDGKLVGRIAAFLNDRFVAYHDSRMGFFGLFDFVNDLEVAQALLESARTRLKEWGCDRIRGPVNHPMGDELGLLSEGFDSSPFVLMPYNPPYYLDIYAKLGLELAKTLYAYHMSATAQPPERLRKIAERIRKSSGVTIRSVNMRNLKADLKIIRMLYNETLDRNFAFVPLSDEDVELLAQDLKVIADPELIMIAEKNGEPIGFSIVFPNINESLRRVGGGPSWWKLLRFLWNFKTRPPKEARLSVLGVKKDYLHLGLGALFYIETLERGRTDYIGGELSWVEEDNKEIIRGIQLMGGEPYKSYQVYETQLLPNPN